MKIINDIATMRQELKAVRNCKKIVFVPTMGNLHDGHLSLVKMADECGDYVVMSIFVNPLQFGPNEDFSTYPRTLENDLKKLQLLDVDIVFTPSTQEMYVDKENASQVTVPIISNELCGFFRPGFFTGIATVVTKLFNIVQPHTAIFGEKDFQQVHIIRQLVRDLDFDIEIKTAPIVRDGDGLAMSSRNQYLTADERAIAPGLYQCLQIAAHEIMSGQKNFAQLEERAKNNLHKMFRPDYLTIRNRRNLQPPSQFDKELIILGAAWLGKARLIDNVSVDL